MDGIGSSTTCVDDVSTASTPAAGSGASSAVVDSCGGAEAESGRNKLPSSRFKGVVPQPNGRWGAQIYEKHRRVWLGTFNAEEEAARAYDTASLRFRGRDAIANFKHAQNDAVEELDFLNARSKAEVVDMLRKHTYRDELQQSKRRTPHASSNPESACSPLDSHSREHLFSKVVTPSDVGKLNRLVIPKQHAERHFPTRHGACGGALLNFEDAAGRVWRFRYSYWNSSQSYVLTRGWSRFVNEKSLRPGDTVRFERSTGPDRRLHIETGPVQNVLRLFGVDIFETPGKRRNDVEVLSFESCVSKKQRVTL